MTSQLGSPGTKAVHDGQTYVEFTRTFRAPIEHVWAAVTESDRLARWVGAWSGDPSTGEVQFQMTFEDTMPPETFRIDECQAPHLLRITSTAPTDGEPEVWRLRMDLTEADGVTTLTFAQDVTDPTQAWDVGPGWHYYLDRLVAAETLGDAASVVWDEHYRSLTDHYRAEFA